MVEATVISSGSTAFALARGRDALERRYLADAIKWLDRARRLSPDDPRIDFHFASAQSLGDPLVAIELLTELVGSWPNYWPAKIALTALLSKVGEATKAASLLSNVLEQAAAPIDNKFCRLADCVAKRAGYSGWVSLDSGGRMLIHLHAAAKAVIFIDTKKISDASCVVGKSTEILLPKTWRAGQHIDVTLASGHHLLGSPLNVRSHTATEGFVEVDEDGNIRGWAWHPGNSRANPKIRLTGQYGVDLINPVEAREPVEVSTPLVEAKGFIIMKAEFPHQKKLRVLSLDGIDLYGSPLFHVAISAAQTEAAARLGHIMSPVPKPLARLPSRRKDDWRPILATNFPNFLSRGICIPARVPRRRDYDVILPAYRGAQEFATCISSVLAVLPNGSRLIVIDDATPEADLRLAIDALIGKNVIVLRNESNRGFPASVNIGIRESFSSHGRERDVILLNSDTVISSYGFQSIVNAAYSGKDIGSVTPMTNDGCAVSYMSAELSSKSELMQDTDGVNAAFCCANKGLLADIPTAVGFCMFIRHDCLSQTGLFREDLFSQGYGEENDWSMRARQLGWRHVVDLTTFVPHLGGRSFGAARIDLQRRNALVLNQLHPGYDDVIRKFHASDALGPARRRVDKLRWRAGIEASGSVVLICHGLKGGVGRHVEERAAALGKLGLRPIIVRPVRDQQNDSGNASKCALSDGSNEPYPHLTFDVERDLDSLASFLKDDRPRWIEIHHILGHSSRIVTLASIMQIPFDLYIHDYAFVCPRVTLSDSAGRYCGEPLDARDCEVCIADRGSRLSEIVSVTALRTRTHDLARSARKIIVPTIDTARRFGRYIDDLSSTVSSWQDDKLLSHTVRRKSASDVTGKLRVCLVGGIGEEKGYSVLLACARDAERRDLDIEFIVIGHTIDDGRLIDTGRVHVTGKFDQPEIGDLLRSHNPDIGFLPSLAPETWCYALSEMWLAGLWVFAFSLGAQGERIAGTGAGTLLPLGIPAAKINEMLLGQTSAR